MTSDRQQQEHRAREEARRTGEVLKDEARKTGQHVKDEAAHSAGRARDQAADQVRDASHAAGSAAEALRERDNPALGDALDSMAEGMESFAHRLRSKNLDELVGEASGAARENPALFYAAAAAAGFLGARLATASRPRPDTHATSAQDERFGARPGAPATTTPAATEGRATGTSTSAQHGRPGGPRKEHGTTPQGEYGGKL